MRGRLFLPSETGSEHSTVITSTCSTVWEPDEEKKDAVVRLFRKKLEDVNGRFHLQLLQLKMLPEMYEEEEALAESFKMQYKNGCRSPFLYIETVRLFEKNPEFLKTDGCL